MTLNSDFALKPSVLATVDVFQGIGEIWMIGCIWLIGCVGSHSCLVGNVSGDAVLMELISSVVLFGTC